MSSKKLRHLFVLGDSISMQYGPGLASALRDHFTYDRKRAPDGNPDDPVAANGGDSANIVRYLRETPPVADLLLLNCGLHDIKRPIAGGPCQVSTEDYRRNLERAIELARQSVARIVWVRTTPVWDEIHRARIEEFARRSEDVFAYNAIADAVMKSTSVPILDLHAFTLPLLPAGFCDHVHFTDDVRQAQASFLAREISELIGKEGKP